MFFGKHDKEELSEIRAMCREIGSSMDQAGSRIEALEKAAGKHDIVLEDLSDTLTELREQEEESLTVLSKELEALRNDRISTEEKNEENLLLLLMEYEANLRNLETLLSDQEEWKEQFEIIHRKIWKKGMIAGVALLGEVGEPVDYEIHEVTDVRETSGRNLDRRVAQVYETGCLYKGYLHKARVSVWKYVEE